MTLNKQRQLNLARSRKSVAKDTRDRKFLTWLKVMRKQSFRTFAMT